MDRPRRLLAATLAMLLSGSCTPRMRPGPSQRAASYPAPVALITEGTAFARPGVREGVTRALEQATGRPVVPMGAPASTTDADVRALAARLLRENAAVAAYDWSEPRCRKDGLVLTPIARGVDAVYRISLDYAERIRPATEVERRQRAPLVRWLLATAHLVQPGSAREEWVTGSIVLTPFTPAAAPRRAPIARIATHLEPTALTARLDAVAVAADAVRTLPVPPAPEWASLARHLASTGCPFLALALSETRVESGPARRDLATAALAQMRRRLPRRRVAPREAATAAPEPPEVSTAPSEPSEPEARASEERYSCSTLCGMHMVEICNQDKALWEAHRTPWQPTPCGTRRGEDFLRECYQWQWLSGSYQDSCLGPCEANPEGRARLLGILQTSGCVRLGRPS